MKMLQEVIILGSRDVGEDDLLVSFIPREGGKRRGLARHGRKSKRRFPNCLFPGSITLLEYEQRPNRDICFLLQGSLKAFPFEGLSDLCALYLASYVLKASDSFLLDGQKEPRVYKLLEEILWGISNRANPYGLTLHFELRLMGLLGYTMNLTECLGCKRSYAFKGKACFHPQKGGIYCLGCSPKTGIILIQPHEVNALLSIGDSYENVPREGLDTSSRERLWRISIAHMKEHLGPIPRSILELREKIFEKEFL